MLNFNKISFFFKFFLNTRKTQYLVAVIETQVAASTNYRASRYHVKEVLILYNNA